MKLEALAERAVSGDREALAELSVALEAPVFRLSLRILGAIGDAEDATQDVLVKVITHLSEFDGRSALTTWVHRIAVRHLLQARKSRAEERALDPSAFAELLDAGLSAASRMPPPTPEQLVLSREVRLTCIQGMLLFLSREERLSLVLVDLLGFDSSEAASVCEVGHDALRQRLHRGREKLTSFMRERCGVVNAEASCRCDEQIGPKLAFGALRADRPRFTELARAGGVGDEQARDALIELRRAHDVAATFHADGPLSAPERLRAKIVAALPRLFDPG